MPVVASRSETKVGRMLVVLGVKIGSVEVMVDYSKSCGGRLEGRVVQSTETNYERRLGRPTTSMLKVDGVRQGIDGSGT